MSSKAPQTDDKHGCVNSAETLVSSGGSSRGTAYIESNKIVTAAGKRHVVWLDAGRGGKEPVRVRTQDLASLQWSDAVTLGEAVDNHGGPVLVRDRAGYLHALFGPHGRQPFSYRRSLFPDDSSQWTVAEPVGTRCTYPSLVCDRHNTLHLTCRENGRLVYYRRRAAEGWHGPLPLVRSMVEDKTYRCYRGSLALDAKDCLHLGFMLFGGEHFRDACALGLAGYLRSADGGDTWTRANGTPVDDLPTETEFDRIPVTDNCIRVSNLGVDANGHPCLVSVSTGFRGYHQQWGQAQLWKHDGMDWQATDLVPGIQTVYPGHRASWIEPSLTFAADGRLFIAITVVDAEQVDPQAAWHGAPASIYGHASSRIVLLVSADAGRSFVASRAGLQTPGIPSWIPSLERCTGHNPVELPQLLYTHGQSGTGLKPHDVVAQIRLFCPE